jgi:methylmalonyl-CoA mutase
MYYEHKKHDGSLPIIGVNTFLNPNGREEFTIELARSSDEEKQSQLTRLADFQSRHSTYTPNALERVQQAAIHNENIFTELVDAVRYCSLGQISQALFNVGGQYRRNM